jgi:ribosome biogenesis GTPase
VVDNPGTREVGMASVGGGITDVFGEISSLSGRCKYSDCTHVHEPGCAVLEAVERCDLDEDQYQNYIKLKKEDEYYEMTDLERRRKDRKFGKLVKNVKNDLRKYKP